MGIAAVALYHAARLGYHAVHVPMALLSLQNIRIEFGGDPVLDNVSLNVEEGDRIAILGANGAGKSTLLRVLGGIAAPDSGTIVRHPRLRVAYLPQEVPADRPGSALDAVCEGGNVDDPTLAVDAEQALLRQGLDPAAPFASLSGGNRRRVLLARALLRSPDVVLLDEPTNHLDLEAIRWLEDNLPRLCRTFVFVTHDRAFLRKMANRIVEIDRGRALDWACDYDRFLVRKEEALAEERKLWDRFDTRLRQEEAWLRQGVKARTHRNQGRLRHLLAMREERAARRTPSGAVSLSIQEAARSGNLVLRAHGVSFGYPGAGPLIRRLETDIVRGDRVGILGPNGCGKTTLVRLLLGDGLAPDSGDIRRGTNLQVVYSDQLRGLLRPDETIAEAVAEGREYVMVDGVRRHILGYLGDFLFAPERARQPVSSLSGGERSRLLMARLFAQPSNVLVLDEPTNDLDLDTLDLLAEKIDAYGGTVLVVSHDRAFLDDVATSTLAFEKFVPETGDWLGEGEGWSVNEYPGGYSDWAARRPKPPRNPETAKNRDSGISESRNPVVAAAGAATKKRLSYNEKRELEMLPGRIDALEREIASLNAALADPETFRTRANEAAGMAERLAAAEAELSAAYDRWGELDERAT